MLATGPYSDRGSRTRYRTSLLRLLKPTPSAYTAPLALFALADPKPALTDCLSEKSRNFSQLNRKCDVSMIRPPMGAERDRADLLPGTLDMLVLKMLMSGHLHGYAIAQLIQQLSDDLLQVEEGSLYPALQRLELNGWIAGEWGVSANNRRARFYKLTPDGRRQLAEESARYRRVTGAVARIMGFA